MEFQKFCQECGGPLEYYGLSSWSSGVWLYGCPKCDILWEQHGDSLTGRITGWRKSFYTLSEWKEREIKRREERQNRKEQQARRAKLRKEGFPEPVALSEELVSSLSEEQRQILFELADLVEKENKLVEKINARRPTKSGILVEGGAITLCEDEDDWKVITMGSRLELERVRKKIVQNLNRALDCGLAHLGIIQRQCANYGVKP